MIQPEDGRCQLSKFGLRGLCSLCCIIARSHAGVKSDPCTYGFLLDRRTSIYGDFRYPVNTAQQRARRLRSNAAGCAPPGWSEKNHKVAIRGVLPRNGKEN